MGGAWCSRIRQHFMFCRARRSGCSGTLMRHMATGEIFLEIRKASWFSLICLIGGRSAMGKPQQQRTPNPDGCVDAQLSPDGELLACYHVRFQSRSLKLSTGQWIFSDVIHATDPHLTVVPISLDRDTPFAGPFGFTLSHDMKPIANRAINGIPMRFSPDGTLVPETCATLFAWT